jgi:glycerophosphoryl diester phosphodiesterase
MAQLNVDIQGHRGCRGLMPENTIPAFIKALEIGVNTLELDVVISKDGKVIVSHEPYMSSTICLDPDGNEIANQEKYNIYEMTYEEVATFDCGSKFHSKFPEQAKIKVSKPLLSAVIDTVDQYLSDNNLPPVKYNIELKSTPKGDDIFHPKPDEFSRIVIDLLKEKKVVEQVIIQSFDERILESFHQLAPEFELAFLVTNIASMKKNLSKLSFQPQLYSPNFKLVNKNTIKQAKVMNIGLVVWTVNEEKDIQKMIDLGVDAIISDYPDRVVKLVNKRTE